MTNILKAYNEGRQAWGYVWDGLTSEAVNPYNIKLDRKRYAAFRKGFEESRDATFRDYH